MITRRALVQNVSGLLAGFTGLLPMAIPGSPAAMPLDAGYWRQLLLRPHHARAIGRAALRARTASHASLINSLQARHPQLARVASLAHRRKLLELAIRDDFTHGRTTLVDGWLLAETEVDLCMLEALSD
ncbi:MAG: hypothetical protein KDG54_00400 [Geminicoccaceae bacterium]|nr:hypothetical protein [Geminicoccaceae bacterium]